MTPKIQEINFLGAEAAPKNQEINFLGARATPKNKGFSVLGVFPPGTENPFIVNRISPATAGPPRSRPHAKGDTGAFPCHLLFTS